MKILSAFLAFSALMLPLSSGSAQTFAERFERFKLWTRCSPVRLVVEDLNEDAADIGLTREDIEINVRSRLRAARIYGSDPRFAPYLYVNVNVVGLAVGISIDFNKHLFDHEFLKASGFAQTWTTGRTGTHGKNSGYILSLISQDTDRFVDAYLRVNGEDCGGPSN